MAALLTGLMAAAAAEHDPALVLQRATIKVRVRAASLPNYTCVETVTRDFYTPRTSATHRSCSTVIGQLSQDPGQDDNLRFTVTDRLRLDVTLTDKGEIYSWAGAASFEDADIGQLVRRGPIGTGSFGAMLAVLFGQDPSTFTFERTVDGLLEYSFHVPQEQSRYKVKTAESWVYTAYSGAFRLDPETAEVARLTIRTAELPASTGSCQTTTSMEFLPVKIGDREFPLPQHGQQRFVDINGDEVDNTTSLASCREYRGESTVSFFADPAAAGPTPGVPAAPPVSLPPGLKFTFELTTPISAATAAGGDPFSGRLVSPLRDSRGKLIAPAHALVEGRLLRFQNEHAAPKESTLVLRLRTIEIAGVKVPLLVDRDWSHTRLAKGAKIQVPYRWETNAALFSLPGEHAVWKAGWRSDWITR
ncbi:MAG TPA: hypothetical protein VG456_23090 [Candidatus Sulfopaludibacter sp.]|nr:hypothetical protein [Candidatus Sulfopaludibacter sp.]